jgi:hypothetical protein
MDLPFDWKYYRHKVVRYLFPFIILYIISTLIGGFFYGFDILDILSGQVGTDYDSRHLFIGILPFWGPGNWFIPVILGGIIVLPQIYKGFANSTVKALLTLVICFMITFFIEYIIHKALKTTYPTSIYDIYPSWENFYNSILLTTCVLFYLFPIGLGMWFSRNHNILNFRNWFMWILFALSLTYLIASTFFNYVPRNKYGVALFATDYNYLVYPYSAFLFLIAMKFLPRESKKRYSKVIKMISKSTYHILLTQILYFAIVVAIYGDHYRASIIGINYDQDFVAFLYLLLNWMICIPIGIVWWYYERKLIKYIKYKLVII